MTTDPFSNPAPAGGEPLPLEELRGSLLCVEPQSFEEGVTTRLGLKDAVRADVYVLDGPQAGREFLGTLIFPMVMIGQLRPKIGQKVLGRVGQGQPKPSQSPPWVLLDASPEDRALATQWLNSRPSRQFASPAGGGYQQQPQQQPRVVGYGEPQQNWPQQPPQTYAQPPQQQPWAQQPQQQQHPEPPF